MDLVEVEILDKDKGRQVYLIIQQSANHNITIAMLPIADADDAEDADDDADDDASDDDDDDDDDADADAALQ